MDPRDRPEDDGMCRYSVHKKNRLCKTETVSGVRDSRGWGWLSLRTFDLGWPFLAQM